MTQSQTQNHMINNRLLTNDFVKVFTNLFSRQVSNFYIIFGRRGSGKTDFALLIAEILHHFKLAKHFATNTEILDSPFRIDHVDTLDDLVFWAKESKHDRKLFIYDEVGKTVGRRSPMSSLNVKLINELQTIRKYKLSLIATTIDESNTDKAILNPSVLDGVFVKPDFENPKKAYFIDYLKNFNPPPFFYIPRTVVKFDTWNSSPFKEHGKHRKPDFKEKDVNDVWEWCHGKTYKQLNLHPMELNRKVRKICKQLLTFYRSQFT